MGTITLDRIHEDLEFIKQKVGFIEDEIITIKSWLDDDGKLSPSEKRLVDETVRKVKAGKFSDMITLEELKKKVGA